MGWFFKNKQVSRESRASSGYEFRRSRTITGSSSPNVRSSAEPRSQLKTERLKLHDLKQLRLKLIKILLVLLLLLVLAFWAVENYISNVTILYSQTGRTAPPTSSYQQTIMHYFAYQPLERFGFMLDSSHLETYLRSQHSEILSLKVAKEWYGGGEKFTVTFRKPLLAWQVGSQKFYVDDKGVAFGYNYFGGNVMSVNDQSGVVPDANGAIASRRFIRFLGKLVAAVNGVGKGQVSEVIVPASTREVDLKLANRNYPIKTHIDRDPSQLAEDLKNALKFFDDNHATPAYIDLRVANRAFYK